MRVEKKLTPISRIKRCEDTASSLSSSSLSVSNEAEASGWKQPNQEMMSNFRLSRAVEVLCSLKKTQLFAIMISACFSFCLGLGMCLVHTIVIHLDNAPKSATRKATLHTLRNFLGRVEESKKSSHRDAAHYEALVHPAMISSDETTRVGIFSVLRENSNESTILRTLHVLNEVSKHSSVEEVVIFGVPVNDPDHQSQGSYRSHSHGFGPNRSRDEEISLLGSYNAECSYGNIDTSTKVCKRSSHKVEMREIIYNGHIMELSEKLDLAIINVGEVDEQDWLFNKGYGEFSLVQVLFKSLSDNGVLVTTLPVHDQTFINSLDDVGFKSIHVYQDSRTRKQLSVQNYIIAFKAIEARSKWYQNTAEMDLRLRQRITRTMLRQFDAHTMTSYQTPHRSVQNNFCRLKPSECMEHMGFDPNAKTLPSTVLTVAKSSVGEYAGRGLFASSTIPAGFIIGLDEQVESFSLNPSSSDILEILYEKDYISGTDYESLVTFVHGYGYAFSHVRGHTEYVIDSGRMLFANHGCNGTDNYGPHYPHYTENTVDLDKVPELFDHIGSFNPVVERHLRQFMTADGGSSRVIAAGEELLTNYLLFSGNVLEDWQEDVSSLRGQCAGSSLGNISAYETY